LNAISTEEALFIEKGDLWKSHPSFRVRAPPAAQTATFQKDVRA
jgi:hypothetical protein